MKQLFCPLMALGTLLLAGCAQRQPQTEAPAATAISIAADGDATIYGLVCDGSNDTIVVFLHEPYDGSNPDTLDILEASRRHQVFGVLRIGDRLAIVRDTTDTTRAAMLVVTQDLLGQWCYKVKPTLRRKAGMEELPADGATGQLPDTIRKLLEQEREYGFALKIDSVAMPIGNRQQTRSADEESPVVYPELQRYRRWYIRNGQLMLALAATDSLGNVVTTRVDSAQFVRLTPDTLVLRFDDGEYGYYRKTEDVE